MKKTLRIFGLSLLGLLVMLFALPVIFKKQISEKVRAEINSQVNGRVDYTDLGFSLIRDFPHPTISLSNFVVTGGDDFKDDTLASIKNFSFSADLLSVLRGNNYRILTLNVTQPVIRLRVNKEGQPNWDILKVRLSFSQDAGMITSDKQADFSFQVRNWKVEHANVSFLNDTAQSFLQLSNLNSTGTQTDNKSGYDFYSNTKTEELTYVAAGITYFCKTKVTADIRFSEEASTGLYSFKENMIQLNALQLQLNGTVKNTVEGQNVALTFQSKGTAFKNLLSLIPAVYDSGFDRLKSEGRFSFSGVVNGFCQGAQYPAISLGLKVENGLFQKADFPEAMKNIFMEANVMKPQGPMDSTVIEVSRLHVESGKDSANANLLITTPATNANIQAQINGNLDLSGLSEFNAMDGVKRLTGLLHLNFKFKGHKNDLDHKNYKLIQASGNAYATEVEYEKKDLPVSVHIKYAGFTVHPEFMSLDKLTARAGKSDFSGAGRLEYVIPYLTHQGRLLATINLQSDEISIRDLITNSAPANTRSRNAGTILPDPATREDKKASNSNIQLIINASAKKVDYDKLILERLNGQLEITGDTVILRNVSADLFGGTVVVNSTSGNLSVGPANVAFRFNISNMDIQQAYKSMDEVGKVAPSLQYINGRFSGELQGSGKLKADKNLNYNMLTADGKLQLPDIKVDELPVLMEIAKLAKVKSLEHLEAKNVQSVFHFKNGTTTIAPTDVKFTSGYKINFNGISNADQTVDADIALDVPVKEFGPVAGLAQNLLSGFMKVPETMQFKFKVTGKSAHPDVKVVGVSTGD